MSLLTDFDRHIDFATGFKKDLMDFVGGENNELTIQIHTVKVFKPDH